MVNLKALVWLAEYTLKLTAQTSPSPRLSLPSTDCLILDPSVGLAPENSFSLEALSQEAVRDHSFADLELGVWEGYRRSLPGNDCLGIVPDTLSFL